YVGVSLNAGLTGSVLFWRTDPLSMTFYNNGHYILWFHSFQALTKNTLLELPFGGTCFSSVDQPAAPNRKRDGDHPYYSYEAVVKVSHGVTIDTRHALDSPAYVTYEHTPSESRSQGVQIPTSAVISANQTSVLHKRAGVPFLPGNLFCPAIDSDILDTPSGSKTCQIYASLNLESDNTGQTADALYKRDEDINAPLVREKAESTMKVCGDPRFPTTLIKIPIPAYGKTQVQTYFDLAYPGKLNPEYSR
ncbi:hypothetical protein C0989_004872, partial [Termitomyces sp. Mn162]